MLSTDKNILYKSIHDYTKHAAQAVSILNKANHCCSEPWKSTLSCALQVYIGYHGRGICTEKMYTTDHMMPGLHTDTFSH